MANISAMRTNGTAVGLHVGSKMVSRQILHDDVALSVVREIARLRLAEPPLSHNEAQDAFFSKTVFRVCSLYKVTGNAYRFSNHRHQSSQQFLRLTAQLRDQARWRGSLRGQYRLQVERRQLPWSSMMLRRWYRGARQSVF